ncbi:MAG: DUF4962 domain-containing protein [Pirellulaceae bacterium]|jgi:hypothetical protein|nr:DUF4962 domain-containing protein [Thermoguttaceae bacterium]NLZ03205.1 DUF4962 domain-containing protein [Pirellulaceae bacterium]
MPNISVIAASILLPVAGLIGSPASKADRLPINFEQGAELADYERLDAGSLDAAVVPREAGAEGHCLRIHNPTPATSCGVRLGGPVKLVKNLVLSFDYRTEIEPGFEGAYLGMIFYVEGKQWFWESDAFSAEWRRAEVPLGSLRPWRGHAVRPGLVFSAIQLYGRVKDKTKAPGETKARMTVYLDNLQIAVSPRRSVLTDRTRQSTANPPMFHWPRPAEKAPQRLQYSRDPGFADDTTVTVDAKWNFFTPPEPLEPGCWYWRVWTGSELIEGWSDIESIEILPEAHRFTTPAIPLDKLADCPRPRLLPVARLAEPSLSDTRRKQLVASAEKLYQQGMPEHPGPHVPGDPRWPEWIDWYGKVAGGITGGTGRRLERIATCAMLTGDARVNQWAKELAQEACRWDPQGGSAMRHGDIGAHHLLRGLNWCYDACRETMTAGEERRLREVIVQRAEQFHERLNPFRGGEANNHAWLQAYGLAESGIVLLGEHDAAAEWTERVRQLYLGRFLSCLGQQGENNEGISYWGYGLGFIIGYADMMRAVCEIDLYRHPWLRQTARFPMYCAPPGAWAVSFADTGKPNHAVRGPAQTRWVRQLALRTSDPYALWYAGEREPVNGLAPKPPTDLAPSIHYRHIGWVIFNTSLVDGSQGTTVALHSGRYFAGHQHPDQNSFVIHAYGEKLAIDGGYYDWWGSPHFDAYSMTTLAHNTLLVDGRGQAVRKPGADGRIARYFDSPGYGYAIGDASAPEVYDGRLSRFDRRILFIKPGFVLVHDLVASAEASRYDWMLHAVAPIETADADNSFRIASPGAALRGRILAPAGARLNVATGFPVEPVDGYSTRPVPAEQYVPEWHLYVTPQSSTAREEFLVAMQIQRLGDQVEPEAVCEPIEATAAHGLRIRAGTGSHLILCREADAEGLLRGGGVESDGEVAAVEVGPGGIVLRAMAIAARKLSHNGRMLLDADQPLDWSSDRIE